MADPVSYEIEWEKVQEYFSKQVSTVHNTAEFLSEIKQIRFSDKKWIKPVVYVYLGFTLLLNHYFFTLSLIITFFILFTMYRYRYNKLQYIEILRSLINDPDVIEHNFGSPNKWIRPSHFQLLAILAKEGYSSDIHKKIPYLNKYGIKKAIQSLSDTQSSRSKSVKNVPLLIRDQEGQPISNKWHFKVLNYKPESTRLINKPNDPLPTLKGWGIHCNYTVMLGLV